MQELFNIRKKKNLLKAALAYVEELRDHHMPMLRAVDMYVLRLAFETRNMIISEEMPQSNWRNCLLLNSQLKEVRR